MSFKDDYPEYDAIEVHIRRAHAERSAAIGAMIGNALASVGLMLRRFTADDSSVNREHERHAIAVDPFLRRSVGSVPRY